MKEIIHIKSITEINKTFGSPAPKHPLIAIMWAKDFPDFSQFYGIKYNSDLFTVSLKDGIEGVMGYGRNNYDFQEGTMVFSKPNQVVSIEEKKVAKDAKGWTLIFHPDLIRKSELGKTINQYIDKHSQKLIISTLELILDYCNRYYDRQFYVRTNLHQDHVTELATLLREYFSSDKPSKLGLPSVKYCGEQLNMSPNYLSDLLKKETGKSAKDHIYAFVVNKAKNKLLGTTDSVSEIAYDLGFEYPQHFSKLFKKQTGTSPAKYRSQN